MSSRFVAGLCKGWVWVLLIGIGATGWSGRADAAVGPDCPWVEHWDDEEGVQFFGYGIVFAKVKYASTGRKLRRMFIDCGSHPDVVEGLKTASRTIRNSRWRRRLYTGLGGYLMWQYGGQEPRSDVVTVTPFIFIPALFMDFVLSGAMENREWITSVLKYRFPRDFRDFQTQARTQRAKVKALHNECQNSVGTNPQWILHCAEACNSFLSEMAPVIKNATRHSPTPWLDDFKPQVHRARLNEIQHVSAYITGEFAVQSKVCNQNLDLNLADLSQVSKQRIELITAQSSACGQALQAIQYWDLYQWDRFTDKNQSIENTRAEAAAKIDALREGAEAVRIHQTALRERAEFEQVVLHCREAYRTVLPADGSDSPGPTSDKWDTMSGLCSAAVESWKPDWPEAERDELEGWIQTAREKQAALITEKEAKEAAEKALREKQKAEAEQRRRAQEREVARENRRYRIACEKQCKSLGPQTWRCVRGLVLEGQTLSARSHRHSPRDGGLSKYAEQQDKAAFFLGMDLKCNCVPADKSLHSKFECSEWEHF
jgi:hypothetical protein